MKTFKGELDEIIEKESLKEKRWRRKIKEKSLKGELGENIEGRAWLKNVEERELDENIQGRAWWNNWKGELEGKTLTEKD